MPLQRTEPWLAEAAIILIDAYLKPTHIVCEFGAGASTKWFGQRTGHVISIEHDFHFYNEIKNELLLHGYGNVSLRLCERPYNKEIDRVSLPYFFDLILVDGRERVHCIQSSIPKLKPGGWLVLDNSERDYYQPGIDLMADWNRVDCMQKQKDKYGFTYPDWTTSIFIKP